MRRELSSMHAGSCMPVYPSVHVAAAAASCIPAHRTYASNHGSNAPAGHAASLLAIYHLGGTLLLRVFYIPILHNTIYKLHVQYNFPRFRREICFLGYFIYQFCIIQYTNYSLNTFSPVFVHAGPCMFIYASCC
jgi:hypothetical protein